MVFKKNNIPWNKGLSSNMQPNYGKKLSLETRQKISESQKKVWRDPEYKQRMSEGRKKRRNTPQFRRKLRNTANELWKQLRDDPQKMEEWKRKKRLSHKKYFESHPKRKKEMSHQTRQRNLELWDKPIFRKKMSKAQVETWKDKEIRRKRCVGIKRGLAQSSLFKQAMANKERRRKLSKSHKNLWKDPEFFKWKMERYQVKPNKAELKLKRLLNKVLPNEYKYVGDGEFILGGKCPDFLNVNGKKKVIELYGDYWHRGDDPQERIDLFKEFGFDALVVWGHELKNEVALSQKLIDFNNLGVA